MGAVCRHPPALRAARRRASRARAVGNLRRHRGNRDLRVAAPRRVSGAWCDGGRSAPRRGGAGGDRLVHIRPTRPRGPTARCAGSPDARRHHGGVVGPAGQTWTGPVSHAQAVNVEGVLLRGVHDLVSAIEQLLREDAIRLLGDSGALPKGSIVLGDPAWISLRETTIEPGVVFDTRNGPVVLESGVEVRSGMRLEGPLWVGANTRLVGGPIRNSAIGPWCVVHGEVSTSAILGYANKGHY